MRRAWVRAVVCGLVLGAASSAHAYFLDETRNFEIRLRAYAGVAIATESSREGPRDPATGRELAHSPDIAPGDILSQRNFYNPEFDAKLTDYTRWTQDVPGFSLISPEEFKFHFAWWGFYDGIFDYANPKWRDALDAAPRARQSESNDIPGESFNFNDENKNPRNILGKRNRINELYLDFTKGRFFTRIGRQSIAWGESDTIILLDVINNFDLTYGAPGFFQDLEEARIPFWAMRNTIKLIDNWGSLSSVFTDMYVVPGPVDTTVPITAPAFFGFPYSQPGTDPHRNPGFSYLVNPVPLQVVIVDRIPKNIWSETRWGVRLAGVVGREHTVQGWFFRTYPTAPVPLLLGSVPSISTTAPFPPTLIDDRGFRTPVCLDSNGNQIKFGNGHTPAGRPCKFARPIVTALYRRLTSVAGLADSYYSGTLGGIIRAEAEMFINQDAFIPSENLDPQVQVPGGSKKVNTIPKANYLRYSVGYDRFFFFRPLNPSNSFILVAAINGQWNTSSGRHKDFRYNGLAKPSKNQVEGQIIPGVAVCAHRPPDGKFPLACQQAPAKNFEDEYEVEQFLQVALQTDYLHGRLEPRIVSILDPSGIFGFQTSFTYRFTDYLLGNVTFVAVEGSRKAGLAVFRDRDQVQMKMIYQLN